MTGFKTDKNQNNHHHRYSENMKAPVKTTRNDINTTKIESLEKPINFEKEGQKKEEKETKEEDLKSKIINKKRF